MTQLADLARAKYLETQQRRAEGLDYADDALEATSAEYLRVGDVVRDLDDTRDGRDWAQITEADGWVGADGAVYMKITARTLHYHPKGQRLRSGGRTQVTVGWEFTVELDGIAPVDRLSVEW